MSKVAIGHPSVPIAIPSHIVLVLLASPRFEPESPFSGPFAVDDRTTPVSNEIRSGLKIGREYFDAHYVLGYAPANGAPIIASQELQ
jgi:hypothetical protein